MAGKATDHLANERTFLAWVRTSLGLIGLGFVLARMGLFLRQLTISARGLAASGSPEIAEMTRGLHSGHEFLVSGVIFLTIGTGFCGWSAWAYFGNLRAIEAERFEPSGRSVVVLTAVVVVGGLALAGLVLGRTIATGE